MKNLHINRLVLAAGFTTLAGVCLAAAPATAPATRPTTAPATAPAVAPGGGGAFALTPATKPADPSKLDAKGYIRQWLILAPINFGASYNAEDIDKDQIPDEAKLAPKEGDKVKVKSEVMEGGTAKMVDKELTWTKHVTSDYYFDLNEMLKLDGSEATGAYAVAYLDAPEEMKDIKFSLSSNDNGKIILNGKSIFKIVVGRALSEDSDVVDKLTLNKGLNTVIFKVWNDSNNWQGCIRLLDKDDKPITNVTVKLAK